MGCGDGDEDGESNEAVVVRTRKRGPDLDHWALLSMKHRSAHRLIASLGRKTTTSATANQDKSSSLYHRHRIVARSYCRCGLFPRFSAVSTHSTFQRTNSVSSTPFQLMAPQIGSSFASVSCSNSNYVRKSRYLRAYSVPYLVNGGIVFVFQHGGPGMCSQYSIGRRTAVYLPIAGN